MHIVSRLEDSNRIHVIIHNQNSVHFIVPYIMAIHRLYNNKICKNRNEHEHDSTTKYILLITQKH